jgi:hypothetical protein
LTAITAATASTSYIDTIAAGDDYVGCWYVMNVETALTSTTTTGTVTFALQTDSSSAFGTATTVVSTAALGSATMVAGYTSKIRIPVGLKRYVRVLMTPSTTISTAIVSNFITKDVDVNAQMVA